MAPVSVFRRHGSTRELPVDLVRVGQRRATKGEGKMEHKKLSADDMPDFIDTAETLGFEHDDPETEAFCDDMKKRQQDDEDSE